jgi:hypothetical protein
MKAQSSTPSNRRPFLATWARVLLILAIALPQAFFAAAPVAAGGTISLTTPGTAYAENFDTLASTGTSSTTPNGWFLYETGTSANTSYTASDGTVATGDTYSFGTGISTERAFGSMYQTACVPMIGASFTNNTGSAITSLAISYTGEQWRYGGTTSSNDRMDFQYSLNATSLSSGAWTDVNSLDFSSVVTSGTARALDGNASANRTAVSYTISDLSIANGATFWLRWNDYNITGTDDELAVDDFSLTATGASNTTTAGAATATATGLTLIAVSMPYTGDANGNNTYTVDYKLSSDSSWTNWVTGAAHVASPYATTITGLTPATSYDVRVTYNDADGVTGTNPQTISGVPTYYTLTVNSGSHGSVTLNPTGGSYASGTVVTLTATGDSGYILNSWSGDLSGHANPTTITMNGNKTVNASFGLGSCVTSSVSASSDDATQGSTSNTMYLTDTTLNTQGGSAQRWWGLRFLNITVPQGATIMSANVTFRAASTTTAIPIMDVYGEDSDNALTFTTTASNISNRTGTAAVVWNMTAWTAGSNYLTPDLATPVQTIVNRAGWSSGNAIVVLGLTRTSDSKVAVAWDDTTQENQASISICYTVSNPTIMTNGTLTAFNSALGLTSAEQSYTVSGANLTEAIVITPPTGFELSLTSGSGFSSSPISLSPDVGGTVASTTIYVHLNPSSQTTYSANITHVSGSATTKNVAVSGSSVPTITTTVSMTAFSAATGATSAQQSYTVSGVNLTDAVVITPPSDFLVSTTNGGPYSASVSLTPTGGVVSSTSVYVVFSRSTAGTSSGNITHAVTGATTRNVAVSGTALPAVNWAAYNDSAWYNGQLSTNVTRFSIYAVSGSGIATSGELVKRSDGSGTGVTAAFTLSSPSVSGTDFQMTNSGAVAASGTDAYSIFNGNVSSVGVINGMGSYTGWYMDLTLSGLDPAKTYTFAATNVRDDSTYTTRNTTFILSGDAAATNLSSSGVTMVDSHTIAFNTGYNSPGYVARWVGINPGSDGTIVIRARASLTSEIAGSINNAYGPSVFMLAEEYSTDPIVSTSVSTLSAFSAPTGSPSAVQSYTVSGSNLTDPIVITPPAEFEISTASSGPWTANPGTITLTPVGGTAPSTPIYVRLNPAGALPYSGVITHVSSGAAQKNVAVSGAAGDPTITVSATSLTEFVTPAGTPSAEQSYTVAGSFLKGDITISAPADFQISKTSGSGWTDSLTFTAVNNTVSTSTVYVRFNRATVGSSSGNIIHASMDATTKNGAVSGTATVAPTTVTFQEGVSGYAGTVDTTVKFSTPTTSYGDQVYFEWDTQEGTGDTPETGLLQFTNIFGSGAGQIPLGSTITSATLRYRIYSNSNSNGDSASVYESLVSWDEATTYNTFGGDAGVQTDEYSSTLVATALATTASTNYTIDVTASLQRWLAGTANYGWVFLAVNTNGVEVHSSEATTADYRPLLTVSYIPPTGPTITTSGTLTPFSSSPGVPSTAQTYTVSGSHLTNDVMITPPAGFEIYTASTGWVASPNSIPLAQGGGTVEATTISVRLNSATEGTPSGNITHVSSGATERDIAVSGTVKSLPPGLPALVKPADNATCVVMPPILEVTVSDPDSATMDVSFYGRSAGGSAEDFTLIVLPDSQKYADPDNYPDRVATFSAQTQWIVDQASARNIVFVTHVGDIVENNYPNGWAAADAAFDKLDPAGVPYSVGIGNNDYTGTDYSLFESNFGVSRFSGKSWYGGHYGSNNVNSYSLFSASGMDFILINLDYNPTTAELDWAKGLLTTYSSRRAIVESHNQLSLTDGWSNQAVYTALKDHANLFLLLSGHLSTTTDGAAKRTDTGDLGQTIYSVLQDYQGWSTVDNGYLRIYRFSPADDKIYMTTYSPTLNAYETTDPDGTLTLAYTMPDGAAYQLIGTDTSVASGSHASTIWSGLANNTEYEWYAAVSDGTTSTIGPTWSFTTGDCVAPTLTITGATADREGMDGSLESGYILETTNVGTINHEIQFAAVSSSSEPLAGLTGLYLNPASVDVPGLTAYYMARIPDGSPAAALAYRAYLIAALDGVTHPFAYITTDGSNNLVLHDAAQYDLAGNLTVGMIVPDNYPLGTYPVQGTARDAAGNGRPVSLSLIVTGELTAPAVSISVGQLSWLEVSRAAGYRVYENTEPYFEPSSFPPEQTSLAYTLPSDTINRYYIVRAVNGLVQSGDSKRVGKFTFTLVPGSEP